MNAHALPIRVTLQNLTVRSPDPVPSLEPRARADGIRLQVRDDNRVGLEPRHEAERCDPPEVARHQQR